MKVDMSLEAERSRGSVFPIKVPLSFVGIEKSS